MAKPKVPPEFASLMPPVSGLLQPTERRLALEKLVPANGPAEKISGLSGDSGSTLATPSSSRVLAMKCRPARITSRPSSVSVLTERSARLMCRYLRMSKSPPEKRNRRMRRRLDFTRSTRARPRRRCCRPCARRGYSVRPPQSFLPKALPISCSASGLSHSREPWTFSTTRPFASTSTVSGMVLAPSMCSSTRLRSR